MHHGRLSTNAKKLAHARNASSLSQPKSGSHGWVCSMRTAWSSSFMRLEEGLPDRLHSLSRIRL